MKNIKDMKDHFNVTFQHVLREGNSVVDNFANIAFFGAGTITFQSFHELQKAGKTLINQNKAKIPNLRVRLARKRPTV